MHCLQKAAGPGVGPVEGEGLVPHPVAACAVASEGHPAGLGFHLWLMVALAT
jgi:hypothetical protein